MLTNWQGLADVGTWLVDQWSWATAVIVAPLAWILGRLRVFATKRADAWIEARWDGFGKWRKTRKELRMKARMERDDRKFMAQLESERVGARFRRREDKDDPGSIMEVIGLAPRQPRFQVRIRAVEAAPDSPAVLVQWSDLTKSERAQRYENARLQLDSYDENDGWVTYERLPDGS